MCWRSTQVGDDAAARQQVCERTADAAFVVAPTGEMKIYVAGGGGRSVATAAESVGREIADQGGSHRRPSRTSRRRRPPTRRAPSSSTPSSSSPSERRWAPAPSAASWARCASRPRFLLRTLTLDGLLGAAGRCGDGLRRRRARRFARPYLGRVRGAVDVRDGRRRRRHGRRCGVRIRGLDAAHPVPGGRRQRGRRGAGRQTAAVAASTPPSR